MPTAVVTCFLRNAGEVLLLRHADAADCRPGQWRAVTGPAGDDPDATAREACASVGVDPGTISPVRAGDPITVSEEEDATVHPYLFDCPTQAVEPDDGVDTHEWVAPTAIRRRKAVPGLWAAYDRVRPTRETVASDADHGSAYLSVRALEVLRDEAALATEWEDVAAAARGLIEARPAMAVLANRIDRTMAAAAGEQTPAAAETAAVTGIKRALGADAAAAASAAERVGRRVATLSRSGTVLAALERADPAAVLVAESRPGREGVTVAETLDAPVTLTTDAAFPHQIAEWEADTLVVGADALLADGRVLNKAGTRGAALAAAHAGVEVIVAASVDKVRRDTAVDLEPRDPGEVYEGDLSVVNPTFDVTPADVVTPVGEAGAIDVAAAVATHREHATWRS